MTQFSNQVSIGDQFFSKERDNAYGDWPTAFWRENLQNAVDAGSSQIDITITPTDHYDFITVHDNGCGMTRDVLENVFFKLGESTKDAGGSQTGGFGRARILTHFSQQRYFIRTGSLNVEGKGGAYNITDTSHLVDGCQMDFEVHNKNRWNNAINWMAKLETYLAACQLPCRVTINGQPWTRWTYRRSAIRELSFGTIHVNKSAIGKGDSGRLLVRVNGTLMFEQSIAPSVLVILEIAPERSREVLQSSRDSLTHEYRHELEKFIEEINCVGKSALRERPRRILVSGSGSFLFRRDQSLVELDPQVKGRPVNVEESVIPGGVRLVADASLNKIAPISDAMDAESTAPKAPSFFDLLIIDETDDVDNDSLQRKLRRGVHSYHPVQWDLAGQFGKPKGHAKARLAIAWKAILQHIIGLYLELTKVDSLAWGVGFAFGRMEALYTKEDGVHFFLLNPLDKEGETRFHPSRDLPILAALATHEVVHIHEKYHDEDFAATMTNLMSKVLATLPELRRKLHDSLANFRKLYSNQAVAY